MKRNIFFSNQLYFCISILVIAGDYCLHNNLWPAVNDDTQRQREQQKSHPAKRLN